MKLAPRPDSAPRHAALDRWVSDVFSLCQPDAVHWCDGSRSEHRFMLGLMLARGTAQRLNPKLRPDSILVRSDPADVARVEDRTFICSVQPEDAGPTNRWADPGPMRQRLRRLFRGCMRGRTLYVVPYRMGPAGSPFARVGVELTDSPYVVANMHLMTRVCPGALDGLGYEGEWVRGLHSVGFPLRSASGAERSDVHWPCNKRDTTIAHFPETREIMSFGSGYGGNALLGKKCHALRIASVQARDEGWLAEHMLIMRLTGPEDQVLHIAAAFPSACGKTSLAMMQPSLPGWTVETLGDDIAWLHPGRDEDGVTRLFAVNPEAGFFGVAPGTNRHTNPHAMDMLTHGCIFTNCALTDDGDVWWEGMTDTPPSGLTDWHGSAWDPALGTPAAHPNARFTAPAAQCPAMADTWEDPRGVPLDAILFGGRRASAVPLVYETLGWAHGVFTGSTVSSEGAVAAAGGVGELRRDPMAMLPFCGYHMADYWRHWLEVGAQVTREHGQLPRVFHVNWFRKDRAGRFLWPGYGENIRVLKWIAQRCTNTGQARHTPIGWVPTPGALDVGGLCLPPRDVHALLDVEASSWMVEAASIHAFYEQFGHRLPEALRREAEALTRALQKTPPAETPSPSLSLHLPQGSP